MPAQESTDQKVAVWVAVQRRAAWYTEDRSRTLVQPEPIRTTTIRAANAVGIRNQPYRSSNAIGRRRILMHRGEREDPSQAEGTDGLGRLTAWASLSLNPRVGAGKARPQGMIRKVHGMNMSRWLT